MLTIGAAPYAAFQAAAKDAFADDLVRFVKTEYIDVVWGWDDDTIREWVDLAMGKAARRTTASQRTVTTLLELMLLLGADFPDGADHDWARDLMAQTGDFGKALALARLATLGE